MKERFLNDNELLYLYRQGDEEALTLLIEKYRRIMAAYARSYAHCVKTSCEVNDIYQVSLIALYKAVESYKENMGCKFGSYFKVVMERAVYNYMRHVYSDICRANRDAISTDQMVNDHEGIYIIDTIASAPKHFGNPVWSFEIKEVMDDINEVVQCFSKHEQHIFRLWEKGFTYREISVLVNESEKKIDNILYKIKSLIREKI